MAQKLLDRSNIVPRLQQMHRKRMPKRMAGCAFGQADLDYGIFHRFFTTGKGLGSV